MSVVSIFAPAKLNLFLAVTGRRTDGFHDLVSVVAPLAFGDTLHAEPAETFSLKCDDPRVPCDGTNLVLKAASAFAEVSAATGSGAVGPAGAKFFLEKRIPMGAGLGGGSSDAIAASLNRLSGNVLGPAALDGIAGRLGSDCPLFLHDGPVTIRGRGERVEPLPPSAAKRVRGRNVLLFKPAFGIATPWAYTRLASVASASEAAAGLLPSDAKALGFRAPGAETTPAYDSAAEAEARLNAWFADPHAPVEALVYNRLEGPAFEKFLALPTLLEELRANFGLAPRMSGSGSACFALLGDDAPVAAITAFIRRAWGDSAFVVAASLS